VKIFQVEAEIFHAGERTEMKVTVSFRNFARTPKTDTTFRCARFTLVNNGSMQ